MSRSKREEQEPDYLAPTKLQTRPGSFAHVVFEAFQLEYGIENRKDIVDFVEFGAPRLSQVLNNPEKLKIETVKTLVEGLERPMNKKRVIDAWVKESFGDVLKPSRQARTTGAVTQKTILRIDQMIRESRLVSAAYLAREASRASTDRLVAEQALDRECWCWQRLDEPGSAMLAAQRIVQRARESGDRLREAAGHYFRSRILIGLTDCTPDEYDKVLDRVASMVALEPAPKEALPYLVPKPAMLETVRRSSRVTFMERGVLPVDSGFLDALLQSSLHKARTGQGYRQKFEAWQMAARVYALKGDFFQAQEAVDKSFASGGFKNLQAMEASGLLMGRIQRHTERPEEAVKYLAKVSNKCKANYDRYHMRLVQWDLARLVSGEM